MEINLSKALSYVGEVKNRAQLRSVLLDMYPGSIQDINILLNIYESGIPDEIKEKQVMDGSAYSFYLERIIKEYGIRRQLAAEALNVWIEAILGEGSIPQSEYSGVPGEGDREEDGDEGELHTLDNLEYEVNHVNEDEVELQIYWGGSSNILVPGVIEGKKVIGIGQEAFMRRQSVVTVKIQKDIEYLGDRAFKNCINLEAVTLPPTLKTVGTECFRNCGLLSEVNLNEGLLEIKEKAFLNCPSIKRILIPSTVQKIGEKVFNKKNVGDILIYCHMHSPAVEHFISEGFEVRDADDFMDDWE